jgi:hypothetical protein
MVGQIKSIVQGPRWAKFPEFIRNLAWKLDLTAELEVDKGFIQETIRFCVKGEAEKLQTFKMVFEASIAKYNKD